MRVTANGGMAISGDAAVIRKLPLESQKVARIFVTALVERLILAECRRPGFVGLSVMFFPASPSKVSCILHNPSWDLTAKKWRLQLRPLLVWRMITLVSRSSECKESYDTGLARSY